MSNSHPPLAPLQTVRRFATPIWGGQRLATWLNLPAPHPQRLGESWQVYDGDPIADGPLAGRTLAEVARAYGAALVGVRTVERYGADFPLLAKFIDAADRLSIQVHPDDSYAHTVEAATGFHGKTEAWYILDAAPDAEVIYGPARSLGRAELAQAVASGSIEALMRHLPVRAGDVVFVPAGTLHAINAGILLFEIQQKSDLTYRVYDYNRLDAKTRQPRELHVAKALDVSDRRPARWNALAPLDLGGGDQLLVACAYFALERWQLHDERHTATDPGSFEILTAIGGSGQVQWSGGERPFAHGDSIVLPAALGAYRIRPAASALTLLRAYVPDLKELMAALQAQGFDRRRVAELVHA